MVAGIVLFICCGCPVLSYILQLYVTGPWGFRVRLVRGRARKSFPIALTRQIEVYISWPDPRIPWHSDSYMHIQCIRALQMEVAVLKESEVVRDTCLPRVLILLRIGRQWAFFKIEAFGSEWNIQAGGMAWQLRSLAVKGTLVQFSASSRQLTTIIPPVLRDLMPSF